MAWTNISNANLDVGAPIRSIDILALRDNISAVANGDAGAPKIQTAGIQDAAVTGAKLSGAQSGSAPVYGARAWINFNGTGTVAIRGSGNISSLVDDGTGRYTLNFTTAMSDVNYAVLASGKRANNDSNGGAQVTVLNMYDYATGSVKILSFELGGNFVDCVHNHVAIYR